MRGTSIPLVMYDECWREVPLDEAEWIGFAIDRHTGRPYPVFLCYSCLPVEEGDENEEEREENQPHDYPYQ